MSNTGREYKHFLLMCSCVSALSCSLVLLGIASDPSGAKSVNTKLIYRLLFCDLAVCLVYGIYYAVDNSLSTDDTYTMNLFCEVYLPFPLYFFIASWGWTALLAYRFSIKPKIGRRQQDQKRTKKLPVPMYTVWLASFVLILPTIIASIATNGGVSAIENSARSRECIYNYSSLVGQVLNITTLLAPMCVTLMYNIYCYWNGLVALQTAPQSVIGRQMRHAGGYVLVLIGVWGPNFAFSMMRVLGGADDAGDFHSLLNASLALSTLQGFFNVIVYVYTNKHTRIWIGGLCTPRPRDLGPWPMPASSSLNNYNLEEGNNSSILKQPTAKILLNQRALLAAKAEEAEYNRYMREKERARQQALLEEKAAAEAEAVAEAAEANGAEATTEGVGEHSGFHRSNSNSNRGQSLTSVEHFPVHGGGMRSHLLTSSASASASGGVAIPGIHFPRDPHSSVGSSSSTTTSSRTHSGSSDMSGHSTSSASQLEAKYLEYRMSASPLARFVAPLWSGYDSDEEDEIARLTEVEGQADNTAANRALGGSSSNSSSSNTLNPLTLALGVNGDSNKNHHHHHHNASSTGNRSRGESDLKFEMSESFGSQRGGSSSSSFMSRDTDTDEEVGSRHGHGHGGDRHISYDSDSTEGRDSEKYVRFGHNDTRLISTNSETRDRMAQISVESENSDPQTLSNTRLNSNSCSSQSSSTAAASSRKK